MKNCVVIRNVKIGEGMPKVCVPLIGKNDKALQEEIKTLIGLEFDMVEWRMDYHEEADDPRKMQETAQMLRRSLKKIPFLATFRSKKEGGEKEISLEEYIALNEAIIQSGAADLIDIELFSGDEVVRSLVDCAHQHQMKAVVSNHDFQKTPAQEEIIKRLCKMQQLGADLPKIAVMPQSTEDVLTLLSATNEMNKKYADRPIITMSMAGLGMISRLSGEIFGSALTFGIVKASSAPGQIGVNQLNQILECIHSNIE